jgi:hypothetical protein
MIADDTHYRDGLIRTRDPVGHPCRPATGCDLRTGLLASLDECITALIESIHDLTDDHLRAFPIEARNCIAWIAVECIMNLDRHANSFQTGERVIPDTAQWKIWWNLFRHERSRQPDSAADFPPVEEIVEQLNAVADAAWKGLLDATPGDLAGNRHAAPEWAPRTAGDAYFRTIAHTNSHVRQIWLLRGALGLTNSHAWPRQHWH